MSDSGEDAQMSGPTMSDVAERLKAEMQSRKRQSADNKSNGDSLDIITDNGSNNNMESPPYKMHTMGSPQNSRVDNVPGTPGYVPYTPHQGEHRQYLRDMILGVNDGLVSMFLLIIGLGGGGLSTLDILLAGITGAVAGAISMALGEYMATKSQVELYDSEIALEKVHFKYHRDIELEQVREFLQSVGLQGGQLEDAVQTIGSNDDHLLQIMKVFEFGQNEDDMRSPITAMLMSGCLFISGSLPSVVPFACTSDVTKALAAAVVMCGFFMFVVGAIKSWYCRGVWWKGGMENLLIGGLGAAVSFGIGSAYDAIRHS